MLTEISKILHNLAADPDPRAYYQEKKRSTVEPNGCKSETKSVEGVDGNNSVRSLIRPPASLSKMSNQKGESLVAMSFCTHTIGWQVEVGGATRNA